MLNFTDIDNIYIYPNKIDYRKGLNSLIVFIQLEIKLSPYMNALFIFLNNRKDSIKIVYWDKTGFALWQKVLAEEKFKWKFTPDPQEAIKLTSDELNLLLEGVDITKIKKHKKIEKKLLF